jgi:hypothetical protein
MQSMFYTTLGPPIYVIFPYLGPPLYIIHPRQPTHLYNHVCLTPLFSPAVYNILLHITQMGPPISMNDHISPAHPSTSTIYISLAYMGPPVPIGNNCTPSPSVIIEDIHNMGPWSAGPSDMGYYVDQVACMIWNLS